MHVIPFEVYMISLENETTTRVGQLIYCDSGLLKTRAMKATFVWKIHVATSFFYGDIYLKSTESCDKNDESGNA